MCQCRIGMGWRGCRWSLVCFTRHAHWRPTRTTRTHATSLPSCEHSLVSRFLSVASLVSCMSCVCVCVCVCVCLSVRESVPVCACLCMRVLVRIFTCVQVFGCSMWKRKVCRVHLQLQKTGYENCVLTA